MSTFEGAFSKKMAEEFVERRDEVIRRAMITAGFNPDDTAFIKEHCQLVGVEGDEFQHFYYHFGLPDQKRIISIGSRPIVNIGWNDGETSREIYKQEISVKYY